MELSSAGSAGGDMPTRGVSDGAEAATRDTMRDALARLCEAGARVPGVGLAEVAHAAAVRGVPSAALQDAEGAWVAWGFLRRDGPTPLYRVTGEAALALARTSHAARWVSVPTPPPHPDYYMPHLCRHRSYNLRDKTKNKIFLYYHHKF